MLTAGGSTFYDLVANRFGKAAVDRLMVLTRSGCYLTHDSGEYAVSFKELRKRSPGVDHLAPASGRHSKCGHVQSRPEPEKVLLTAGKRDISFDSATATAEMGRPAPSATAGDIKSLDSEHVVTGSTISTATFRCRAAALSRWATWWRSASRIPARPSTNGRCCASSMTYDIVSAVRTSSDHAIGK